MTGTINPQETNFRIQALQIDELLDGTKCINRRSDGQGHGHHHHHHQFNGY